MLKISQEMQNSETGLSKTVFSNCMPFDYCYLVSLVRSISFFVASGQCEGEVLAAAAQPAVLLLASLRLRVLLLIKTSTRVTIEDMRLSMVDPLY